MIDEGYVSSTSSQKKEQAEKITLFQLAEKDAVTGELVRSGCRYCQLVAMALVRCQIAHETVLIDGANKPSFFLELYPKGSMPILQVGKRVIGDSKSIVSYIEKRLRPKGVISIDPKKDGVSGLGALNLTGWVWKRGGEA